MSKGAQIVSTPWRNQKELLKVKSWLYQVQPNYGEETEDMRRKACDQISAWKLRGRLPHAVESTWHLTEACLADELPNIPIYCLKAGYVTAISRFVTGLVDAEQDSRYKVSMYAKAQQIGLPALFVDIRHEGAHGEMPLLDNLRSAARRALLWLWDHYWKNQERPLQDIEREMQHNGDVKRRRASQQGDWAQWTGLWSETSIGVVP